MKVLYECIPMLVFIYHWKEKKKILFYKRKPKGVGTQTKALDEYILTACLCCFLKRVHFCAPRRIHFTDQSSQETHWRNAKNNTAKWRQADLSLLATVRCTGPRPFFISIFFLRRLSKTWRPCHSEPRLLFCVVRLYFGCIFQWILQTLIAFNVFCW